MKSRLGYDRALTLVKVNDSNEWLRQIYYISTVLSYLLLQIHIPGDDTVLSPKLPRGLVQSDDTEDVKHSTNDDRGEKWNANGFYYGVDVPE